MSFPRHAKYIDSGVDWLGQIPSHWAVKRLRFVAELNPSKSEVSHLAADTEVSFLPMEAIGEDGSLELDRVRPLADVQTGYTFFRDGDVTIAKITPCFENGKGAAMRGLCNGIGFGTTELIVTRPKATQTISTYLQWLFTSRPFRKAGEAFMYGAGGQKRVPDDFVRDFAIGFPPLPEQRYIVNFLDREAAKIDALVEEQRSLIELLKEKRQVVISRAVTKGLNPNAPMKDSGVEWLGKVPAHWDVLPCRAIVYEKTAKNDGAKCQDYLSLMANIGVIPYADKGDVGNKAPEDLSKCKLVSAGDIVINSMNYGIGSFGLSSLDGVCSPVYVVLRPNNAIVETRFAFRLFANRTFQTYAQSFGNGILAHRAAIGWDTLKAIGIPVPPIDEQLVILTHVDTQTEKFEALIAEAEAWVILLQERRSALGACAADRFQHHATPPTSDFE
jgi:type I restriction enzyme S subunit